MNTKEAILYIHGSHCTVKNMAIDQFEKDLINGNTFADIIVTSDIDKESGEAIKKVMVTYHESQKVKEFYIFEIFWGDLRRTFSEERPIQRFFKSTGLIGYWLFSGIWRAIFSTPRMAIPLLFSMILVVGWYFSLLLIVADGFIEYFKEYDQLDSVINVLTQWKSWAWWGIFTLLLTVFPTGKIINMAHFSRNYLQDKTLRAQIRERIINVVEKIKNDDRFDSIQFMAHSFGSVILTEFLSHENIPLGNKKIRVVTLGASLGFILNRARWVKEMLFKAQSNAKIQRWQDYFSYKDWLCSVTPQDTSTTTFKSIEIKQPVPFGEQVSGHSHQMYFSEVDVLKEILICQ